MVHSTSLELPSDFAILCDCFPPSKTRKKWVVHIKGHVKMSGKREKLN